MQNIVEQFFPIKQYDLDESQYTLSLIKESLAHNIYNAKQIETIQMDLMNLLGEQILRYTHLESSSVKTEEAQMVLQSILYCCDVYLLGLASIKQAVERLVDLKQVHQNGLILIKDNILIIKEQLAKLKQNKLDIQNTAYQQTIEHGFDEFIIKYDVNFGAQNNPVVIDYPLLFDDINQTGVVSIKNYLSRLQLENEFCSIFSISDINCFLLSYGVRCNVRGSELIENVADLLLRNLLCGSMLGKRETTLFLTKQDCELLQKELFGLSDQQCKQGVEIAFSLLLNRINASSELKEYLMPYANIFSPLLFQAVNKGNLHHLILV